VAPPGQQFESKKLFIKRRSVPLNDYTNSNTIWTGLFPQNFPLGQGPSADSGPLNMLERRHLVFQFNPEIGNHPLVLPLMFSQTQRSKFAAGLKAAVKNNTKSFNEFKALQADPSFKRRLKDAIAAPGSKVSRALTIQLSRVLRVFSPMLPFSPAARRAKLGDFLAMVRFFGNPTLFITRSPDPVGDTNTLRRTYTPRNNFREFPNTDSGFAHALINKDEWTFKTHDGKENTARLNLSSAMKIANGFPVIFGEGYRQDTEHVYEDLLGVPIANRGNKTTPVPKAACCGVTWAISGVNEDTGKGWSHLHATSNSGNFI
jgi:hypothetical protein